jgi:hypothetical protein
MLEGSLIAAAAGLLVLAVLSFRSTRLLEQLKNVLPDKGLVDRLVETQDALTQSIEAQRRAVLELPRNVAGTVAAEVKPLSESLVRSHDHFSRAVLTLDQDGSLGEWVGGIREAVEPLQAVSTAIERHYDTAGQVLRTTSGLVEQWASQREAVVHAFQRFAETVERSAAAETTHLRDVEHRVMNRLEEVAETNAAVAHSLSELQTASRNTLETQAGLARSVEATVQRTSELIDLGKQTQTQHHELIRSPQGAQNDLARWQKDADQGLKRLHESVGQIAEATAQSLGQTRQELQRSISALQALLKEFHQTHGQALAQLQARQEAAAQREQEVANQQKGLIADVRGMLEGLPARRFQLTSMALLGAQVVLTAILLAGFLLR